MLTPEALEAFQTLKDKCVQAPVLAFPYFKKPFLLETDASGKGLGAVLLQKQDSGCYHPIAFTGRALTETKQRYHSSSYSHSNNGLAVNRILQSIKTR